MLTKKETLLLDAVKQRGFNLTPIAEASIVCSFKFALGSVSGTLCCQRDAGAIHLVEIRNADPHNGTFGCVMDAFEEIVRRFNICLYVMHIQDPKLSRHLVHKRKYAPVDKGSLYHLVYPAPDPDT